MQLVDNFPLKDITTLNIGGPARQFVVTSNQAELIQALQYAIRMRLPYLVIGGGSNLLVSDDGVDKLIIKNEVEGIIKEVRTLKVKSGTILQHLVDYSIGNNLAGLQKLTGIPGTVGGAIFGNAGAYGQTISDHIREVKCLDQNGQEILFDKEECEFGYRDSIFKKNHYTILEVVFRLEAGENIQLRKEADGVLEKRLIKYPKGIKCPGSFFKNLVAVDLPEEILRNIPKEKVVFGKVPAGALLEEVGAKEDSLGDIEIADYHANLFINKGAGTAQDFYNLAKKYHRLVKERYGIILEPEVQLINLPSLD